MRVHSEEQYALINAAVERYKKTNQWQEENGRYIPDPDTFLQDERWTDEIKLSEAVQAADREAQEKDEWIAKIRSAGQRYLQRKENTDWLVLWGWTGRK